MFLCDAADRKYGGRSCTKNSGEVHELRRGGRRKGGRLNIGGVSKMNTWRGMCVSLIEKKCER